jgi:poly(A) polymerase
MSEQILRRLRYPNQVIDAVVTAVRNHMGFKNVVHMRPSRLKRMLAAPNFDDELELHRVDCLASNGMLDNYFYLLAKREEFAAEPLIPPPLVTGRDLIAAGWNPGPVFSEILTAVQNHQLDGSLTNKTEALEWVAQNFGAAENR